MSQTEKSGRLFVVGTPIGNLEDLSPRALRTLLEADAIFCEDTRVTAKLAARFGLPALRVSCPGPREESRVTELLDRLGRRETVAFVSDAGMPALSDPGARLVEAARAAGIPPERAVLAADLPAAVAAARAVAGPGTVVLLSPAAPSYNAYRNFEARGDHFRALVQG